MSRALAVVAIVCASFFVACECPEPASDEIRDSEFLGTYKAEFGTALLDEMEFRSDSTYVHRYQGKAGPVLADTNRYKFFLWPGSRFYSVNLNRFVFLDRQQSCWSFTNSGADWNQPMSIGLSVKRRGSRLSIALCPDEHKYYVKVK